MKFIFLIMFFLASPLTARTDAENRIGLSGGGTLFFLPIHYRFSAQYWLLKNHAFNISYTGYVFNIHSEDEIIKPQFLDFSYSYIHSRYSAYASAGIGRRVVTSVYYEEITPNSALYGRSFPEVKRETESIGGTFSLGKLWVFEKNFLDLCLIKVFIPFKFIKEDFVFRDPPLSASFLLEESGNSVDNRISENRDSYKREALKRDKKPRITDMLTLTIGYLF